MGEEGLYVAKKVPVVTTTQRDLLIAVEGMLIFNSTTDQLEEYDGAVWEAVGKIYGDATFLPLAGGTMTGALNMGNQKLPAGFEALRELLSELKLSSLTPAYGWTSTVTGSGSIVTQNPSRMTLRVTTDLAPNSTVLAYIPAFGKNKNTLSHLLIDWDKKLSFFFMVARDTSNAASVQHCQIKEAVTLGVLGEKGIDLQIEDLALKGYAYGTSLSAELDLGVTLTSTRPVWIRIDLTSAGVEFFVDNVSKGSITTAGKFPTGDGVATVVVMFSNDNGGTATQCDVHIGDPFILQEA